MFLSRIVLEMINFHSWLFYISTYDILNILYTMFNGTDGRHRLYLINILIYYRLCLIGGVI